MDQNSTPANLYRGLDYRNMETGRKEYGIEVKPGKLPTESKLNWFHVHLDGKVLVYRSAGKRDATVARLDSGGEL